ncbi:hypothetical protein BJ878DRAFT_475687 [Calycina marina]|uniref:Uncharacterized protein n=1 Tax=Calycina marina TaxID=1763456 RepID=A0A9P7ZC68_9HELO|nr:hypothetical protein BJ878DRAFT_475687 [Calycina marina]
MASSCSPKLPLMCEKAEREGVCKKEFLQHWRDEFKSIQESKNMSKPAQLHNAERYPWRRYRGDEPFPGCEDAVKYVTQLSHMKDLANQKNRGEEFSKFWFHFIKLTAKDLGVDKGSICDREPQEAEYVREKMAWDAFFEPTSKEKFPGIDPRPPKLAVPVEEIPPYTFECFDPQRAARVAAILSADFPQVLMYSPSYDSQKMSQAPWPLVSSVQHPMYSSTASTTISMDTSSAYERSICTGLEPNLYRDQITYPGSSQKKTDIPVFRPKERDIELIRSEVRSEHVASPDNINTQQKSHPRRLPSVSEILKTPLPSHLTVSKSDCINKNKITPVKRTAEDDLARYHQNTGVKQYTVATSCKPPVRINNITFSIKASNESRSEVVNEDVKGKTDESGDLESARETS